MSTWQPEGVIDLEPAPQKAWQPEGVIDLEPPPTAQSPKVDPLELARRQVNRPAEIAKAQEENGLEFSDVLNAFDAVDGDPLANGPEYQVRIKQELYRRRYRSALDELAYGTAGGILQMESAAYGTAGSLFVDPMWNIKPSVPAPFGYEIVRPDFYILTGQKPKPLDTSKPFYKEWSDNWNAKANELYKWSQDESLQPGKGGGFLGYAANITGQTLTLIAASTAAQLVVPGGAFFVSAMAEGDNWVRQGIAEGKSPEELALGRIVVGTINGVIEVAQVGQVLRAGKGIAKGAEKTVMKEFAAAVQERALKKIAATGGRLTKQHIEGAIKEGFEEVAQQWVGMGAAQIEYSKEYTLSDYLEQGKQAGIGGTTAGFILGTGTLVLEGTRELGIKQENGEPAPLKPMIVQEEPGPQPGATAQETVQTGTVAPTLTEVQGGQAQAATPETPVGPGGEVAAPVAARPPQTPEDAQQALTIFQRYRETGDESILSDLPPGTIIHIRPEEVSDSLAKMLDTPVKRSEHRAKIVDIANQIENGETDLNKEDLANEIAAYQRVWGATDPMNPGFLKYMGLDDLIVGVAAPVPARPEAAAKAEGKQPWEIIDRKGQEAVQWQNGEATISVETRPKTKAGTGGRRYVARVGDQEYAAVNLDSAKQWADEALAKMEQVVPKGEKALPGVTESGRIIRPESAPSAPVSEPKTPSGLESGQSAQQAPGATERATAEPPVITSPRQDILDEDYRALTGNDRPNSKDKLSMRQAHEQAVAEGVPEQALRIATEVSASGRLLTPAEVAGLTHKMAQIKKEHIDLMGRIGSTEDPATVSDLSARITTLENEWEVLNSSLYKNGSEAGRRLVFQKLALNQDFSLISVKARAKVAKGEALTVQEIGKFEKLTADLAAKDAQVQDLQKQLNQLQADAMLKRLKEAQTRKPKTGQEKAATRSELTAKLKELLAAGC